MTKEENEKYTSCYGGMNASVKTLHDEYTMAALTGLLANTNRDGSEEAFIADARAYADEAMRQRGEV